MAYPMRPRTIVCSFCTRRFASQRARLEHAEAKHSGRSAATELAISDRKALAAALLALGQRAKDGAALDLPTEAAALGIPPARLVRSLQAQGAPIGDTP